MVVGGWWWVVGGWWLVVGGGWLVVGGSWFVVVVAVFSVPGKSIPSFTTAPEALPWTFARAGTADKDNTQTTTTVTRRSRVVGVIVAWGS